jgi:hypothetical protein
MGISSFWHATFFSQKIEQNALHLPAYPLHYPLQYNKTDGVGDPPTWSLAQLSTLIPFLNSPPRNSLSMTSYFNVKVMAHGIDFMHVLTYVANTAIE